MFFFWLVVVILAIILLAFIVHWAGGAALDLRLGHFILNVGFNYPAAPAAAGPATLVAGPAAALRLRLPGDAAQEARWALAIATSIRRKAVRYDDESVTLPPRTPAEARALVSRLLAPLIRHDAEHGTDYVGTLRVVLRVDRSWQDAAAELHIHRQTLGYRIRKIEQVTGRGVTRTDDIAQWWLALRAHDLLTGRDAGSAAQA